MRILDTFIHQTCNGRVFLLCIGFVTYTLMRTRFAGFMVLT